MKIIIGSDHAGYALKKCLADEICRDGHEVEDAGNFNEDPVDFPDIAKQLCTAILSGKAQRGIMFCGTGIGACIACNKIAGIRAGLCHDLYSAHQCVEHDDVQVLCLGAQVIGHTVALEIIQLFLKAEFSGQKEFKNRIEKLQRMDTSRTEGYSKEDVK